MEDGGSGGRRIGGLGGLGDQGIRPSPCWLAPRSAMSCACSRTSSSMDCSSATRSSSSVGIRSAPACVSASARSAAFVASLGRSRSAVIVASSTGVPLGYPAPRSTKRALLVAWRAASVGEREQLVEPGDLDDLARRGLDVHELDLSADLAHALQ